jgi:hypothetical protein
MGAITSTAVQTGQPHMNSSYAVKRLHHRPCRSSEVLLEATSQALRFGSRYELTRHGHGHPSHVAVGRRDKVVALTSSEHAVNPKL